MIVQLKKNTLNFIGLSMIILSVVLSYYDYNSFSPSKDLQLSSPFLHFGIACLFLLMSTFDRNHYKRKSSFFRIERSIISLTLFWISCFTLNKEIPIFYESTTSLSVLITICTISFIVPVFITINNNLLKSVFGITSALSTLLFLYFSFYLLPYTPIGLFGLIIIGLGGHIFVPLAMLIFQLVNVRKFFKSQTFKLAYIVTIIVAIFFVIGYIIQFQLANSKVYEICEKTKQQNQYPTWVKIAQQSPENYFVSTIIKKNLISPSFFLDVNFDLPSKEFEGIKRHNPLIIIADLFTPKNKKNYLTTNECIKIISSNFQKHDNTTERLWSGDDLQTSKIKTEIDLHPEFRLAYTEKTFHIKNIAKKKSWQQQQEAIYHFYMPEGTVVTSLALWIDGKEEKAILTSKEKAETAYKTIVGKERRDPSLITWQEGNIVRVRVFPCTPDKVRQVKIGFTSPLRVDNQELIYESINFEGPNAALANESITYFSKYPIETSLPKLDKNSKSYNGKHLPNWLLKTAIVPLNKTPFCFNNKSYHISELKTKEDKIDLHDVYLDLTKNWNKNEILEIIKDTRLKYYSFIDNKKTEITPKNIDDLLPLFKNIRFGLFPFHKIDTPQNSIVITKGGKYSVKMSDLKNKNAYNDLKRWQENNHIKVFLLGETLTPYQKALLELRTIKLLTGNMKKLNSIFEHQNFEVAIEDNNTIAIHSAHISISQRKNITTNSNSTDHLMRLYSYNSILRDLPYNYINNNAPQGLIDRAKEAYVVSPISSLVVLETKNDYDRFDIQETKNSLKNAPISDFAHYISIMALISYYLFFLLKERYSILKRKRH